MSFIFVCVFSQLMHFVYMGRLSPKFKIQLYHTCSPLLPLALNPNEITDIYPVLNIVPVVTGSLGMIKQKQIDNK